ncbi:MULTISPECIES: hypothetical protein [Candidatus Ichthyocystis]|nr:MULTISPECIES: hypothetical protein [Ichthyocystis]
MTRESINWSSSLVIPSSSVSYTTGSVAVGSSSLVPVVVRIVFYR